MTDSAPGPIDAAEPQEPEQAPLPVLALADLLAAATKQEGPRLTPIDVPEWGTRLMARPLTRTERIWLEERCVDARTGKKDLKRADMETFCRMVAQPKFRPADYEQLLDSEPAARVLDRIHIELATINDGIRRDRQGRPLEGEPADGVEAAAARLKR